MGSTEVAPEGPTIRAIGAEVPHRGETVATEIWTLPVTAARDAPRDTVQTAVEIIGPGHNEVVVLDGTQSRDRVFRSLKADTTYFARARSMDGGKALSGFTTVTVRTPPFVSPPGQVRVVRSSVDRIQFTAQPGLIRGKPAPYTSGRLVTTSGRFSPWLTTDAPPTGPIRLDSLGFPLNPGEEVFAEFTSSERRLSEPAPNRSSTGFLRVRLPLLPEVDLVRADETDGVRITASLLPSPGWPEDTALWVIPPPELGRDTANEELFIGHEELPPGQYNVGVVAIDVFDKPHALTNAVSITVVAKPEPPVDPNPTEDPTEEPKRPETEIEPGTDTPAEPPAVPLSPPAGQFEVQTRLLPIDGGWISTESWPVDVEGVRYHLPTGKPFTFLPVAFPGYRLVSVKAPNGQILQPGEDGNYTFTSDTVVSQLTVEFAPE